MNDCGNCHNSCKVLIKVKLYLGEDEDWGPQYHETLWCLRCVTQDGVL